MHCTAEETDIQVPKPWHLDYGSPITPVYLGLRESWGVDFWCWNRESPGQTKMSWPLYLIGAFCFSSQAGLGQGLAAEPQERSVQLKTLGEEIAANTYLPLTALSRLAPLNGQSPARIGGPVEAPCEVKLCLPPDWLHSLPRRPQHQGKLVRWSQSLNISLWSGLFTWDRATVPAAAVWLSAFAERAAAVSAPLAAQRMEWRSAQAESRVSRVPRAPITSSFRSFVIQRFWIWQ